MFVEFIRGGHATRHYAEGHAAYLRDTVRRSVRELEEATPEAAIRNATRNCIQLLKRLDRELSGIRAALDNDTALAVLGDRMKNIRKDLERAQSEL